MDKEKDLEKKKNYGEQYQELLEEQGYLFVNDPPVAEVITRYTYQDYLDWPEDERVELIDGQIYYMAAPSWNHQELLLKLGTRFGNYLHGKKCDVIVAPFDVRIDFAIGNDSIIQPDILVVCDREKLINGKSLKGAPDFIIEILSPSNRGHDLVVKYNKYLEVGVCEYWIVDPDKEEIMVDILSDDKSHYIRTTYKKGDEIKVTILDDLIINVTDTFEGYRGGEIVEVEQRIFAIAKKMIERGDALIEIAELTNLTIEQINDLLGNE